MGQGQAPDITAIVSTRNRGDSAVMTVKSLLANSYASFAVLVIDQSEDNSTEVALRPYRDDPRFRYVRSETVGLGRSHNIGVTATDSPLLAFTDDDCEVPADWLSHLVEVFDDEPKVGVVFTNVVPGPHDESLGFVPAYLRDETYIATSAFGKLRAWGIGAGMAVRRTALLEIGMFDENMGAGALFASADDRDIAIRAVLNDWWVCETSETEVVHHGFRTWQEGRELAKRDWLGLGAMCAKPLRAGHWSSLVFIVFQVGIAIRAPFKQVLIGRRPRGFRRIVYFVQGFKLGWRTPVDRERIVFDVERTVNHV